jgi:hypothetical protein
MAWSGSVTTTVTIMPCLRAEIPRRPALWLAATGALALVPKCGLCLIAYLGLGSALGLGGAEICGAAYDGMWGSWLASTGVAALAIAGIIVVQRRARGATATPTGGAGCPQPAPAGPLPGSALRTTHSTHGGPSAGRVAAVDHELAAGDEL